MRTQFQQCGSRDTKYLFRAILVTFHIIAILSLILYFALKNSDERPYVTTTIGFQICIALGSLITVYWTKMLGFFGSISAFTVPFIVLLTTGQLTNFDNLST